LRKFFSKCKTSTHLGLNIGRRTCFIKKKQILGKIITIFVVLVQNSAFLGIVPYVSKSE